MYIWLRRGKSQVSSESQLPSISVVICARNAAAHLMENLPSILDQNYHDFEVVVVNDRSEDNTSSVLADFRSKYSRLRIVSSELEGKGWLKKQALTKGIRSAQNECLVLTDADCKPLNHEWLKAFGKRFSSGSELILGVGFFQTAPGFLNALFRFESMRIAVQYLAAANADRAFMAVGRSIGYTKSLFERVGGFDGHADIQSGDDDLFVVAAAPHANTSAAPEACTVSAPATSFKEWLAQKKRHRSTGIHYPVFALCYLGLYDISMLLCTVGIFCVIFLFEMPVSLTFSLLIIFRTVLLFQNIGWVDIKSGMKALSVQLLLLELPLSLVYALLSIPTLGTKPFQWRKRISAIERSEI
ncbi:MAG: glycosyltransferase [Flavobacteriales bacterium]